jgi:CRISPR-associated endonuclease/helicase Cas3
MNSDKETTKNCTKKFFAHSLPGRPPEEWQPLKDHLKQVAHRASLFAEKFQAGDWAYRAGLWHDLGKFSKKFRRMLLRTDAPEDDKRTGGRVDHSTAGARRAVKLWPDAGKLLAYIIAGHHSGLPDGKNSSGSDLANRLDLQRTIPDISNACPEILKAETKPTLTFRQEKDRIGFQLSFFIRMLYSCLVDADFLDTEKFLDSQKALHREGRQPLADLEKPLIEKLHSFKPDSAINKKRADILQACIDAASNAPGLFTLTVPTGGGKTLSSLAFALRHAKIHHKDHIIYVIPFTSIIEQNAAVFRSVLGEEAVLEHHSNYTPENIKTDDEDDSIQAKRHRLSCENWDSPVIVTTNVQFFDSLFANRSSKCRKLHNIVNSVIILDEAQMLPEPYLRPCLETIRELTINYGCTVVLCTATQPALTKSTSFPYGLPGDSITEIMQDPRQLHTAFKRVCLNMVGRISNGQLSKRIAEQNRALCIVNTRQRAVDIFQLIHSLSGAYHLSARMCPAHRSQVLTNIRAALDNDQDCRVISTQLVEAGVDLDFPIVYREMAGLDAIAQAAGRCNRNAKVKQGEVFVFLPEDGRVPKLFRRSAAAAESVLRRFEDPFTPDAIFDYFSQVYWIAGEELDKKQILASFESGVRAADLPFCEIAQQFRLIESEMVPVIIPWDETAEKQIEKLRYGEFPGVVLRRLQPYTVQIYPQELAQLQRLGAIQMIHERYPVLVSLVPFYKTESGVSSEETDLPPEMFFV